MQTIHANPAGETLMIKRKKIYSMLLKDAVPPLIYTGESGASCMKADYLRVCRLEHPHCAFFKKEIELKGMNVLRRTLYTTDDWLHTDYQIFPDGRLELLKKYIKNENDLKSLYFYLTDVSVNVNAGIDSPEPGIHIYHTTMLPMEQCLDIWMDREEYNVLLKKNEQLVKKCFYHMSQILTTETKMISETVHADSTSVIYLGNYLLDCDDEEYMQWRCGFIKKIRKLSGLPVMIHIDNIQEDTCSLLSETGADIIEISLTSDGIGAEKVLDSSGGSFVMLEVDVLDNLDSLKNIDIIGRGVFSSADNEKLDKLKRLLEK